MMASDRETRELRHELKGGIAGVILGVLTILAGLALLGFTFKLAYAMFTTDPRQLLGIGAKPLDVSAALTTLMSVVIRILLLVFMAAVGGGIAKHGIHLYVDSRHTPSKIVIRERESEPNGPKGDPEELPGTPRRERIG